MFKPAKLKIENAKSHLITLDKNLQRFVNSDFFEIKIEKSPDVFQVSIYQTEKPPELISATIGDILHNLKSALDYSYCEYIREYAKVNLNPKTQIRIFDTRENLISALTKGHGILNGKIESAEIIADVFKPYKENNEESYLHILHDLNITDKHINLIPIFTPSTAELKNVKMMGFIEIKNLKIELNPSGTTNLLKSVNYPNTQFELDESSITYSVLFAEGQPLGGKSVTQELKNLISFTENLIENLKLKLRCSQ